MYMSIIPYLHGDSCLYLLQRSQIQVLHANIVI